jgi:hypothetical protein
MQCAKFCGHQEKTSWKEMTFSRTAKMRFAWKFWVWTLCSPTSRPRLCRADLMACIGNKMTAQFFSDSGISKTKSVNCDISYLKRLMGFCFRKAHCSRRNTFRCFFFDVFFFFFFFFPFHYAVCCECLRLRKWT